MSVAHLKLLLIIFIDLQVLFIFQILIHCVHVKLQSWHFLLISLSFLKIAQSL